MKQTIELQVPKQLQLICELLDTTPQEILQGFLNDVSLSWASNGSDERSMAVQYFLRVGYGMHRYEYEEVEQMFEGLNWLRCQQYEKKGKDLSKLRYTFLKTWLRGWQCKKKK